MYQRRRLPPDQALQKVRHYCAYQERSHQEVRQKLFSLGLNRQETELLLSQLIEEGALNEQRFASAFAGGKFRMKQWGRKKIASALKQRGISSYCITNALSSIDSEQYITVLKQQAEKKWRSVKGSGVNRYVKMSKTTAYLLQKGYEPALVREAVIQLVDATGEKPPPEK